MELRFSRGGVLEVTSRELKNFQRGLRIFGEIGQFCMHMYGCELWNLSSSYTDKYIIAWRKI